MKKTLLLLISFVWSFTFTVVDAQEVITVEGPEGEDEEIVLPEGLTMEEDSLLQLWQSKTYLYTDTTCQKPNYNPEFPEEVYRERLRRMPCIMEMPWNPIVQKFIDRYTNRLRRSVSYMLASGNFYIPLFEEALDLYGLPIELKYLPVIESALDPFAVSPAGAAGLWQFMLGTGKQYGLRVNSLVDERRDPIKSTLAAAKYLRDLYKIYGDWSLVIAAYNCGPGKVNQAIHRANGSRDYWEIYPYLPRETRGYVPAFIAANYIMNYYCDHNICAMRTRMPMATDTIVVSKDLHFVQIAELCNIDINAIKALNPQYKMQVVPGDWEPSVLRLPLETINTLIDYKDSIYNYKADELFKRRSSVEVKEVVVPKVAVKVAKGKGKTKAAKSQRASRRGKASSGKKAGRGAKSSGKSSAHKKSSKKSSKKKRR